MNIVELEAMNFAKHFAQRINGLKSAKENLEEKLNNFAGTKSKLDFLTITRSETDKLAQKHKNKCQTPNCSMHRNYDIALFATDQELEINSINYVPDKATDDNFTIEQKVNLHCKINEVLEKLSNLETGQEVIFYEIDELKEHFNLGKKNWFKLLKGKLLDLGIEKAIEVAILNEIYQALAEGIDNSKLFLLK